MPELPEVETVKNGLNPLIQNMKVERVKVHNRSLRWPISSKFAKSVKAGGKLVEVSRRAKYLVFAMDKGCIVNHLGMTGVWKFKEKDYLLEKHDHVELLLEKGKRLIYNDPRRFGMMDYFANPEDFFKQKDFGPEPLSKGYNVKYLFQVLQKKTAPIKNVVMDQKIVLGIGNIYACEALFHCGVLPDRPSNEVTKEEAGDFVLYSKKVLRQAIKAGGSTIKDFKKAGGESGYFQNKFFVYGRAGQQCLNCRSHQIENIRLAGRSSFYCSNCQK